MFSALGRYWWEGKRRKGRHLLSIKKKKLKIAHIYLILEKLRQITFFLLLFLFGHISALWLEV